MHTPWDQFQKSLLATFLELLGEVEIQREVLSQVQAIDLAFQPDERAQNENRLGLLGRVAGEGRCMIECFSRPPTVNDIDACIRKQLVYHQDLVLRARKKKQPRPDKPVLWVFTSGRPETVLDAYEARAMEGWPAGFWQTRRAERLHLVVVKELPPTEDTLLLRLLGRHATLDRAMKEFFRLPESSLLRQLATSLLVAFLGWISHNSRESDVMNFVQEFRAQGEAILRQSRLEGRLEGERNLLKRQLSRRFGPLPDRMVERIEQASADDIERWAVEIFDAGSLEELLDS